MTEDELEAEMQRLAEHMREEVERTMFDAIAGQPGTFDGLEARTQWAQSDVDPYEDIKKMVDLVAKRPAIVAPPLTVHESEWVPEFGPVVAEDAHERFMASVCWHVVPGIVPLTEEERIVYVFDGKIIGHPRTIAAMREKGAL